ncbi:unnamed protein product [Cyprideis torosa]|uniref:Uncharacterized protein n=1 Tax=Cyprideis torosa TaxID=163714 RepID=A0A7R8W3C4_9CRUS|nr:unnamed protein product [Cyprideis torosa]CAG0881986.1 unnamed protein product [Cyprideis torosa]
MAEAYCPTLQPQAQGQAAGSKASRAGCPSCPARADGPAYWRPLWVDFGIVGPSGADCNPNPSHSGAHDTEVFGTLLSILYGIMNRPFPLDGGGYLESDDQVEYQDWQGQPGVVRPLFHSFETTCARNEGRGRRTANGISQPSIMLDEGIPQPMALLDDAVSSEEDEMRAIAMSSSPEENNEPYPSRDYDVNGFVPAGREPSALGSGGPVDSMMAQLTSNLHQLWEHLKSGKPNSESAAVRMMNGGGGNRAKVRNDLDSSFGMRSFVNSAPSPRGQRDPNNSGGQFVRTWNSSDWATRAGYELPTAATVGGEGDARSLSSQLEIINQPFIEPAGQLQTSTNPGNDSRFASASTPSKVKRPLQVLQTSSLRVVQGAPTASKAVNNASQQNHHRRLPEDPVSRRWAQFELLPSGGIEESRPAVFANASMFLDPQRRRRMSPVASPSVGRNWPEEPSTNVWKHMITSMSHLQEIVCYQAQRLNQLESQVEDLVNKERRASAQRPPSESERRPRGTAITSSGLMNNQVEPGSRANNYWDAYRSCSFHQNAFEDPSGRGGGGGRAESDHSAHSPRGSGDRRAVPRKNNLGRSPSRQARGGQRRDPAEDDGAKSDDALETMLRNLLQTCQGREQQFMELLQAIRRFNDDKISDNRNLRNEVEDKESLPPRQRAMSRPQADSSSRASRNRALPGQELQRAILNFPSRNDELGAEGGRDGEPLTTLSLFHPPLSPNSLSSHGPGPKNAVAAKRNVKNQESSGVPRAAAEEFPLVPRTGDRGGVVSSISIPKVACAGGARPKHNEHVEDSENGRTGSVPRTNPACENTGHGFLPDSQHPTTQLVGMPTPISPLKQTQAVTNKSRQHRRSSEPTAAAGADRASVAICDNFSTLLSASSASGTPMLSLQPRPPLNPFVHGMAAAPTSFSSNTATSDGAESDSNAPRVNLISLIPPSSSRSSQDGTSSGCEEDELARGLEASRSGGTGSTEAHSHSPTRDSASTSPIMVSSTSAPPVPPRRSDEVSSSVNFPTSESPPRNVILQQQQQQYGHQETVPDGDLLAEADQSTPSGSVAASFLRPDCAADDGLGVTPPMSVDPDTDDDRGSRPESEEEEASESRASIRKRRHP